MALRYLDDATFANVVENVPLVSVDLIVMKQEKVLLGKRRNKPAQGYWFTLGGRVHKHETISDALKRVAEDELGSVPQSEPKFIGIFEHLYDDGIFENVSTHYVNLGYRVKVDDVTGLPEAQHDDYRWFDVGELLNSDSVHRYVKDYFTQHKGTIPQD